MKARFQFLHLNLTAKDSCSNISYSYILYRLASADNIICNFLPQPLVSFIKLEMETWNTQNIPTN